MSVFDVTRRGYVAYLACWVACMGGCPLTIGLGSECASLDGACQRADASAPLPVDSDATADVDADGEACASSLQGNSCACWATDFKARSAHWALDETSGAIASDVSRLGVNGALQNFTGQVPWTAGEAAGA